jgi:hypothetical protein
MLASPTTEFFNHAPEAHSLRADFGEQPKRVPCTRHISGKRASVWSETGADGEYTSGHHLRHAA